MQKINTQFTVKLAILLVAIIAVAGCKKADETEKLQYKELYTDLYDNSDALISRLTEEQDSGITYYYFRNLDVEHAVQVVNIPADTFCYNPSDLNYTYFPQKSTTEWRFKKDTKDTIRGVIYNPGDTSSINKIIITLVRSNVAALDSFVCE